MSLRRGTSESIIAAGLQSGITPRFKNLITGKVDDISNVDGTFLHGSLSRRVEYAKGQDNTYSYSLSLEADYKLLYERHAEPEKRALVDDEIMMRLERQFKKQTTYSAGPFDTQEEALVHLDRIETIFAHILETQGAYG